MEIYGPEQTEDINIIVLQEILEDPVEMMTMTLQALEEKKDTWGLNFFFLLLLLLLLLFFIYGCVGSSFLCEGSLQLWQVGATLHRGARASHYRGLSCCGAQAPDAQAQ